MKPNDISKLLAERNYNFVSGVPDSIFKILIQSIDHDANFEHVITNNEGEACALAAGYYIATGKVPLVYMQNSGLGNSINPLTSLLDAHIYSIPTLLLIAWRGMPGEKDEPQHKRMGEILPGMLSLLDIKYGIADTSIDRLSFILDDAARNFKAHSKPYAILFPKNSIGSVVNENKKTDALSQDSIIREDLLDCLVQNSTENDIIITTTGKTSRELFEIRVKHKHSHDRDFLTVGSMGCASSIALGIAMQRPNNRVILVDGDGACLMRMEAMATIGHVQPKNLIHIVVDNNAYESTGSQKTLSNNVNFEEIANACSYRSTMTIKTLDIFSSALATFKSGPALWLIKSHPFSRPDLKRPTTTPVQNKKSLMQRLGVMP